MSLPALAKRRLKPDVLREMINLARIIGATEAEQTERDGRKVRNDRMIDVATHKLEVM